MLQVRELALDLIRHILPPETTDRIDFDSIVPGKESFADPKMKYHFLDVCYVGQMKSGTSVRISILFEHKSSVPDIPVHFQLLRYISLLNYAEIRHNKKPSVVFPILLYHGKEPWKHISMREYYGELTHEEYACIPKFDYHVVDVSSMTEVELERIPSSLLGTFLYTLFLGVRPELVLQKLKQTANFVSGLMSLDQWMEIYEIITAYLSSVSPEFEQKFRDMKYDFVTPAEKAAKAFETNYMAPRLREAHRKGLEEGIEKGRMEGIEKGIEQILKAYISHHLHLSDEAIAGQFSVPLELVQRLRAELSA
jgi:predicted transposase/invertase (TIGR01784 family)